MITGPPDSPSMSGTESSGNTANYDWSSPRSYVYVENQTGYTLLLKIDGEASTTNWDYQVAAGERFRLGAVLSRISLYFTGGTPVRTGSANANFTVKGWAYPNLGVL